MQEHQNQYFVKEKKSLWLPLANMQNHVYISALRQLTHHFTVRLSVLPKAKEQASSKGDGNYRFP